MNESKINCHCPSEAKLKFCFLIGKRIRSTKVACVDGYAFKILHNLGFHQFRYTSWPPNLHSEAIISECCIALRDLLKIARMRYRREKKHQNKNFCIARHMLYSCTGNNSWFCTLKNMPTTGWLARSKNMLQIIVYSHVKILICRSTY